LQPNDFSPVCVCMCIMNLLDLENIFPHTWQQNAFSPVCVCLCMVKLAEWEFFPTLPHFWKPNRFFVVASDSSYARWIIWPCHKTILFVLLHASSEFTSLVKRLLTNFACGPLSRLDKLFFVTKSVKLECCFHCPFLKAETNKLFRPLAIQCRRFC